MGCATSVRRRPQRKRRRPFWMSLRAIDQSYAAPGCAVHERGARRRITEGTERERTEPRRRIAKLRRKSDDERREAEDERRRRVGQCPAPNDPATSPCRRGRLLISPRRSTSRTAHHPRAPPDRARPEPARRGAGRARATPRTRRAANDSPPGRGRTPSPASVQHTHDRRAPRTRSAPSVAPPGAAPSL